MSVESKKSSRAEEQQGVSININEPDQIAYVDGREINFPTEEVPFLWDLLGSLTRRPNATVTNDIIWRDIVKAMRERIAEPPLFFYPEYDSSFLDSLSTEARRLLGNDPKVITKVMQRVNDKEIQIGYRLHARVTVVKPAKN